MNYTKLFYWLTVADNSKAFFVWMIVILTILVLVTIIAYFMGFDSDIKKDNPNQSIESKFWFRWFMPFLIVFWLLYVFTPTKKDALLIVAGGQTLNYLSNDSTARAIPHEALNFVVTELRCMSSDLKLNLNIQTQKEKILDEAKAMTGIELMNKMNTDSIFRRIILNK